MVGAAVAGGSSGLNGCPMVGEWVLGGCGGVMKAGGERSNQHHIKIEMSNCEFPVNGATIGAVLGRFRKGSRDLTGEF